MNWRPMLGLLTLLMRNKGIVLGVGLGDSYAEGGSGNEDDPDEEVFHGDAPYVFTLEFGHGVIVFGESLTR